MCLKFKRSKQEKAGATTESTFSGSSSITTVSSSASSSPKLSKPVTKRRVRFDVEPGKEDTKEEEKSEKTKARIGAKMIVKKRQQQQQQQQQQREKSLQENLQQQAALHLTPKPVSPPLHGPGIKQTMTNINSISPPVNRVNSGEGLSRNHKGSTPLDANARKNLNQKKPSSALLSDRTDGHTLVGQGPRQENVASSGVEEPENGGNRRHSVNLRSSLGSANAGLGLVSKGQSLTTTARTGGATMTRSQQIGQSRPQSYCHPPNVAAQMWMMEKSGHSQGNLTHHPYQYQPHQHQWRQQLHSPPPLPRIQSPVHQQIQSLLLHAQSSGPVTQREIGHHRRNSTQMIHQQHVLYNRQARNPEHQHHHHQPQSQSQHYQQHFIPPQRTQPGAGLSMHSPLLRTTSGPAAPPGYIPISSTSRPVIPLRRHSTPSQSLLVSISSCSGDSSSSNGGGSGGGSGGDLIPRNHQSTYPVHRTSVLGHHPSGAASGAQTRQSVDTSGLAYFHNSSSFLNNSSSEDISLPLGQLAYHHQRRQQHQQPPRSRTPGVDSKRSSISRKSLDGKGMIMCMESGEGDLRKINNGMQLKIYNMMTS